MRNIVLVVSFLICSSVRADESKSVWSIDAAVTPWFASWKQTSTAAERFGADAINVNYKIDDAIAYNLEFTIHYKNVSVNLVNTNQSQQAQQNANELSQNQFGITVDKLFDTYHLDYRYTQGDFNGFIDGTDNNGNTGTGTFISDLTIQDLSLMIYKGFGLGFRQTNYELPQDIYLVANTDPNTALISGFQEISYSGTYFQLVAMSEDNYIRNTKQRAGLSYVFRYGLGKLTPGGQFLSDTEALLQANSSIAANENLMQEDESTFIEADISYFKRFDILNSAAKASFGYRFTEWEASFSSNSSYQIVTDFKTSFSGPYLKFTGEF